MDDDSVGGERDAVQDDGSAAGGENGGEPQALASGTFAVYEDGAGGFVLVTNMPDHGGVARRHIPSALVKMVTGGGMLSRKLGGIFGG